MRKNTNLTLKGSRGQGTQVTGKINTFGLAEKLARTKNAYNTNSGDMATKRMLKGMSTQKREHQ